MLYGPDGCRSDVEYANATMASLKKIAKELQLANQLKEAELLIRLGEEDQAMDIIHDLRTRSGN